MAELDDDVKLEMADARLEEVLREAIAEAHIKPAEHAVKCIWSRGCRRCGWIRRGS